MQRRQSNTIPKGFLMFRVIKTISFEASHRILEGTSSEVQLHGHTFNVMISFIYSNIFKVLDKEKKVKKIRKIFSDTISNEFDHCTILNSNDPLIENLNDSKNNTLSFPGDPTIENLAEYIFEAFSGIQELKDINGKLEKVSVCVDKHEIFEYFDASKPMDKNTVLN